jgi:dihydrofolate synthase/folylpolyglutamate synthase
MLEAILDSAGYRIAAYTSPHLLRYNERVRIAGASASDEALCDAFARVEAARGDIPLTYFEFGTLAALDLFRHERVPLALLEVGLGGRLDAVNVIDADVAVLTSIGTDHQDWLGPDRETIGREKAGIFRAGRPAICGDPEPPASIGENAAAIGARLYQLGREFSWQRQDGGWTWRSAAHARTGLPYPAMRGDYQLDNASCVLMALECLAHDFPVSQAHIRTGLLTSVLPGRFQTLPGLPVRVLDVAHNIEAAQALARTLAAQPVFGHTIAVVGMLKDKPITEVLRALAPQVATWHLASLAASPRGASAEQLASHLREVGVNATPCLHADPLAAYHAALSEAGPQDRVVAFGSFYTVGAILPVAAREEEER